MYIIILFSNVFIIVCIVQSLQKFDQSWKIELKMGQLEFASRQIRTPSQIFDFLVLFCREFNADSYGTILNNFRYVLAEI